MWSDDNVHDPLGSWINNHVLLDHIQGRTIWFAAVNILIPEQICCKFADNIFTSIFQNEKRNWSFFPRFQWIIKQQLGQKKAWLQTSDKPLHDPSFMMFYDTPRYPMITHTSDSHQIPSQNKKSKLQILKIGKNSNLARNTHTWHTFLSCLITCINMKWIEPEL